jgi:adenosylcobinamide kinase/adenosylcobinamide-phosphate guanylyltransferase
MRPSVIGTEQEIVLVLGGARSGKSAWAQRYVEGTYRSRLFLATAEILDEEMEDRVRLHREARGPEWKLVEEPLDLAGALSGRCDGADAVLVDCLTVWLGNVMVKEGDAGVRPRREGLLRALESRTRSTILVSNEVGMGIVPEHRLGRAFRDEAGALNQAVARAADRVVLLAAGLPLWLKGEKGREP